MATYCESASAPLTGDPYTATLLLRELMVAARDELATADSPAHRLEILREFVDAALPETKVAGSAMFEELFLVLRAAVTP